MRVLNNYCVYKHTSPSGKVYVGITGRDPTQRWNNGKGYKNNSHFWRAICKYGWYAFKHEILYSCISKTDAARIEKELIAKYKSNDGRFGYNITEGGEVNILPHDSCVKISIANKGRRFSKEARKKMSDSRKQLLKTRPELAATRTGYKMTEEHKKKMIASAHEKIKKRVQCVETGDIYESLTAASKRTGTNLASLSEALHGRQKTAGGFTWRLAEVVT